MRGQRQLAATDGADGVPAEPLGDAVVVEGVGAHRHRPDRLLRGVVLQAHGALRLRRVARPHLSQQALDGLGGGGETSSLGPRNDVLVAYAPAHVVSDLVVSRVPRPPRRPHDRVAPAFILNHAPEAVVHLSLHLRPAGRRSETR